MGSNPIGMAGGGISHARPLLFLLLSLIFCLFPLGIPAKSCHKCYQKHYRERNQSSSFITHTHVSSHCYDPSKLSTCRQNRGKYCIARNLGKSENILGSKCPKGERWICFTFSFKGRVQDLVKEESVNKKGKPAQQSDSVSAPINKLNLIMRLQTVVEIITNITRWALELISSQQSQTKPIIYQNRLALD